MLSTTFEPVALAINVGGDAVKQWVPRCDVSYEGLTIVAAGHSQQGPVG